MDGTRTTVNQQSPADLKIGLFRSLFRGREDVYPRRFESRKTGKSGYAPACANEWVRASASVGIRIHLAPESTVSMVQRAHQDATVAPVTAAVVKSVDEIPAVCLEDDLIAIFRLTSREMRLWRKFPEFIPFPPLPMLDRQIRGSGCVVAWFLAQDSSEYYRKFKSPLEELTKGKRGRSRQPWWKFAPPHGDPYRVMPLDGEKSALGVDKVAEILRTTPSALRRGIREPDFPLPPAKPRPLRWTEGQIERLLWAPQDHNEHLQKTQRSHQKAKRSAR